MGFDDEIADAFTEMLETFDAVSITITPADGSGVITRDVIIDYGPQEPDYETDGKATIYVATGYISRDATEGQAVPAEGDKWTIASVDWTIKRINRQDEAATSVSIARRVRIEHSHQNHRIRRT